MSNTVYNGTALSPERTLQVCPEEHHTSFSAEYTADGSGNVAATAIITPQSGNRLAVHLFQINTSGASGECALDFVTSSQVVARLYADKQNKIEAFQDHTEGNIDEALTLEVSGIGSGKKVFVKVQYVEER